MRWIACALLVTAIGCAHAPARSTAPSPGGQRDLAAAAMPFEVLVAEGGREIAPEAFFSALAAADAVCLGEKHSSPHHHWAQQRIVDELSRRRSGSRALGLEMVQRPFQGVVDDYAADRITEAEFLARTGWQERWGYDFSLYRPILEVARARGLDIVALNAEGDLVRAVSDSGLEGLSPAEREKLPEIDLDDRAHRAWFTALMADMGGAACHGADNPHETCDPDSPEARAQADRVYTSQLVWDETMAESAAGWLSAHPGGQIIILAGNGHCIEGAIPRRLERRGDHEVISVRIAIAAHPGDIAALLAHPRNDYLFVMSPE